MEQARNAVGRYEWMRPLPCLEHNWISVFTCFACERAFKATAEWEHATGNLLQSQMDALREGRREYAAEGLDKTTGSVMATRIGWLQDLCDQWGYAPDDREEMSDDEPGKPTDKFPITRGAIACGDPPSPFSDSPGVGSPIRDPDCPKYRASLGLDPIPPKLHGPEYKPPVFGVKVAHFFYIKNLILNIYY